MTIILELVAMFSIITFLPAGMIYLWRKRREATHRSPFTQKLLRGPGESLRTEGEALFGEAAMLLMVFPTIPLLIYSIHLSQSYFGGAKESDLRTLVGILMAVGFMSFLVVKLVKLLKRISNLRLGYEGEVAIAQELNQLMREGAYVFHDVPAEGFNIDHVIVWQKGVFAVETKARMKPKRDRGNEDATVVFDGQKLLFPGWVESAPLEQAARQAKWLGQWLSGAVGETVAVKPVLALPGWFVDRRGKSEVFLVSGREASNAISKWTQTPLSNELVTRIAHQMDARCRDVEPRYFQKRNGISAGA